MRSSLLWTSLLMFNACGGGGTEGSNPGECTDLADNDADGYFDCQDADCANSPECLDEDTDLDETDDTQVTGTGDVCTDMVSKPSHPISSFTLDMTMDWDWDEATENAYCNDLVTLFCDCVMHYVGTGTTRVAGDGNRMIFEGTFELGPNTTCEDQPNSIPHEGVWYPDAGEEDEVYHSLTLSADGTQVTDWMVHHYQQDCDPVSEGIVDAEQNYLIDIEEPITNGVATHTYSDVVTQLLLTGTITTNATWTLTE